MFSEIKIHLQQIKDRKPLHTNKNIKRNTIEILELKRTRSEIYIGDDKDI